MKIAVCAGHSDFDPGTTANGCREAELMDELGHIVTVKLRQMGYHVVEDGPKGENWPLERAAALIKGTDIAVELHTNSSTNPQARGVEVVAALKDRRLAQGIAQAIAEILGTKTRQDAGFFEADAHRKARGWNNPALFVRAGGLIVECFFQSNRDELTNYFMRKWLVATAIAEAIDQEAKRRLAN